MRLLDVKTRQPKRSDAAHLFLMGDVHVGNRNADLGHWQRDIAKVRKTPNAHVLLMGDLVDAIFPSDKRFDEREVDPQFRDRLDNLPEAEVDWLVESLWPIKDRILAILTGNHEEKVRDVTGRIGVRYDPHYEICRRLDGKSLDYCGFLRWKIVSANLSKRNVENGWGDTVTIFANHGFGSGQTPGSHAQALTRLMDGYEADICVLAHRHQRFVWQRERLTVTRRGQLGLVVRHPIGIMPGSYLKSATPGHPGYAVRKGLHAAPIGCVELAIRAESGAESIKAIIEA